MKHAGGVILLNLYRLKEVTFWTKVSRFFPQVDGLAFSLTMKMRDQVSEVSTEVFDRSFGQAFDRVWSFLNSFSKRPREKRRKRNIRKKKKKGEEREKGKRE